jgi:magnesium transporter
MPRIINRAAGKLGLPPGTLVYTGEKKKEKVKITVIDYDETQFEEKEVKTVKECVPFKDKSTVTWINIDGVHLVDVIGEIGKHFDVHPLVLEDIVNIEQRPKMEDFEDYLFIVLKMLHYDEKVGSIKAEQVSIILCQHCIISFQEEEGDVFNIIRERIRSGKGRIRKMGPDYLAYALIDAIVDNYFNILEKVGEKIEHIEEELITNPTSETLQTIYALKRDMIFLRRSVFPLREVISRLERGETPLIKETTEMYLRDVYEHTIQVIDAIEAYRDMLSGMLDIYLSSVSNRMNDVMKVLTIFAAIFIPLSFIAGIYGMNFPNMPELEWKFSYPIILLVMAVMVVSMLVYFKRKQWL